MIIEKIQHHLALSFVLLLVFAQSMFFIGSKAAMDSQDNLNAFFVNPAPGANVEIGERLYLEAALYLPEEEKFDLVFFNVSNQTQNYNQNYSAYKIGDSYVSEYGWDTTGLPEGEYYLQATAYVYDEDSIITHTYTSNVTAINLIKPVEYVAQAEILQDPILDDIIEIVTPLANEVINQDETMIVKVRTLSPASTDIVLNIYLQNSTSQIVASTTISNYQPDNNDSRHVFWSTDNIDISNVDTGDYTLRAVRASRNDSGTFVELEDNIPIHINQVATNQPEEQTLVGLPDITAVYPADNDRHVSGIVDIELELDREWPSEYELFTGVQSNLSSGVIPIENSTDISQQINIIWPTNQMDALGEPVFDDAVVGGQETGVEYQIVVYAYLAGTDIDQNNPYIIIPGFVVDNYTDGVQLDLSGHGMGSAGQYYFQVQANNQVDSIIGELVYTANNVVGLPEFDFDNLGANLWSAEVPLADNMVSGNYILYVTSTVDGVSYGFDQQIQLVIGETLVWPNQLFFQFEVFGPDSNGQIRVEVETDLLGFNTLMYIIDEENGDRIKHYVPSETDNGYLVTFDAYDDLAPGDYRLLFEIEKPDGSFYSPALSRIFNVPLLNQPENNFDDPILEIESIVAEWDAGGNNYHFRAKTNFTDNDIQDFKFLLTRSGFGDNPLADLNVMYIASDGGFYASFHPEDILIRGSYRLTAVVTKLDGTLWSPVEPYFILQYFEENNNDQQINDLNQEVVAEDEDTTVEVDENIVPKVVVHFRDKKMYSGEFIIVSSNVKLDEPPTLGFKSPRAISDSPKLTQALDDCKQREFISQKNYEEIEKLGHYYCYYFTIPDKLEDGAVDANFISSEYNVYLNYKYNSQVYPNDHISGDRFIYPGIELVIDDGFNARVITYSKSTEESNIASRTKNNNAISFTLSQSCQDLRIYDEEDCRQFLAIIDDNIDEQCIEASIYDSQSCEDYLRLKTVESLCQAESIVDTEACKDFMLEKYASTVECKLDDLVECTTILRDKYFNRLVVNKQKQELIKKATDPILGQVLTLEDLQNKLLVNQVSEKVLPLAPTPEVKVLVAASKEQTILESENLLTFRNQAVLIVDTDGDGLSDDMEKYHGTDLSNPDTDGDGYLDGEEVKNGYNPNGEGKLERERSLFDELALNDSLLEQPKRLSEKVDKDFVIEVSKQEDNKIKLSGTAEANTWVTIFLYSDLPLVMTTKTDESGNWTYDIQQSLNDGSHKVYVTVNDNTGNIVKQSDPLAFLVKSAQAVTADQYFDVNQGSALSERSNFFWYYVAGAGLLVLFGIFIIFILHRSKSNNY